MKIGCPVCGAVLTVREVAGMESMSVTCPVCKTRSPFRDFRKVAGPPEGDQDTQLGGPAIPRNNAPGRLSVVGMSLSYQLMPGRNVIGRKAGGSGAHFQIPCNDRRMSREHLVIEVSKVPGGGFAHHASLFKERVNPTYIGGTRLEWGDKVELEGGCVIRLPGMDLRFDIPDEEGTEL